MSVYHYDNARVVRRLLGFILIVVGVILMTVLYYVKIRAQSAKVERAGLAVQIEREEVALNVLRAEIAHLESPERLNNLASEHLGLVPTSIENVIQSREIETRFSLREPVLSEGRQADPKAIGGQQ